MNLDFKYYFSVFLRRIHWFIILTAIGTSAGLTVAMLLPPEYTARAQLLVEREQIPTELAASTVRTPADQQLRILQERLMVRQNLLDVANRLDIYAAERAEGEAPSAGAIVGDIRKRSSFWRNGPFLNVQYRHEDPEIATKVANEFVTLILQENVQLRTEQAGDTLEFFEQEVDRLGAELDRLSVQLIEYQNEVGVSLPGNLDFLRARLRDVQDRIASRERDIESQTEQKIRITELFETTGRLTAINNGPQQSPLEQRLQSARRELSDAQLVFSDQNPKLNFLRARVAALEEQVAEETIARAEDEGVDNDGLSPQQALFEKQINEIDARIELAEQDIERLREEAGQLEGNIASAPANGVEMDKLRRDVRNVQQQYNRAVDRLSAAATGERIELLAKGQRISVIEQAVRPNRPTKPNRPLIAMGGVGGGIFAGLGLILLLELLNRSIRRPVELTNRLGITPIGVLPYMRTEREIVLKRLTLMAIGVFLLLIVPLGLYAVHTLYFPLTTVLEPIANRLGYSISG